MTCAARSQPAVGDRQVSFELDDTDGVVTAVRLVQDVGIPADRLAFARAGAAGPWRLRLDRPPVGRLEYLFEARLADGTVQTICDPGNPRATPAPFGPKSVVEFPGYAAPHWLYAEVPAGRVRTLHLPSRGLGAATTCELWASAGAPEGARLPLLVVHDGPEFARFASLVRFLDAMVAAGRLPAMRAALLAPVHRSEHYSASPAYARALALALLPALDQVAPAPPGRAGRIGMGASLGALAMLHAQRRHPETFGGVLLQSGSFFQPRLDDMESGMQRFRRITAFVRGVLRAGPDRPDAVPAVLSCGSVEENLANNAHLARALGAQGYGARLHVHPDGHNWVSWRDVLDPCLLDVAEQVWG